MARLLLRGGFSSISSHKADRAFLSLRCWIWHFGRLDFVRCYQITKNRSRFFFFCLSPMSKLQISWILGRKIQTFWENLVKTTFAVDLIGFGKEFPGFLIKFREKKVRRLWESSWIFRFCVKNLVTLVKTKISLHYSDYCSDQKVENFNYFKNIKFWISKNR